MAAGADVVLLDYILNECLLDVAAQVPGKPAAVLLNFLLPPGYREQLGLPTLPAYMPEILTGITTPLPFLARLRNAVEFAATRLMAEGVYTAFHAQRHLAPYALPFPFPSSPSPPLNRSESRASANGEHREYRSMLHDAILYLNPMELLLDTPRPLNARVKHVGASATALPTAAPVLSPFRFEVRPDFGPRPKIPNPLQGCGIYSMMRCLPPCLEAP